MKKVISVIMAAFLLVGALASVAGASHAEPTCGVFKLYDPTPDDPGSGDEVIALVSWPGVTPDKTGESWTVEYKKGQIYHIDVDGKQHKADRDGHVVTFHGYSCRYI